MYLSILKNYPYVYWIGVLGSLVYVTVNNGIFSALLLGWFALLLYRWIVRQM